MTQPGQGVGPGEVLFSVFSQSIRKGGKGDLTLKSGKGIEVKGADEASGKGAGRMRDADLEKVRNPAYAKLAADVLKKFPTDKATGIGLGSAGIMGLMKKFPKQRNYLIDRTIKLFDALFPQGGYSKEFKQALEADDVKNAHYYYGLSNMQQYHIVKASGGQDQAYLFVDTANSPATTTYIDSFADGLAGLKKGVLKMKIAGSPYIVAKVGREKEAYPKVSLYPAK
jgi:hypothetical protein